MGSHNSKIGSRDPLVTPIDLIFQFWVVPPCSLSVWENWHEYLHRRPLYMAIFPLRGFGCKMPIRANFEVFLGFDRLNVVRYCRDPQKADPWPETRVLTYRSSRSVKKCDLGAWRRKQKKGFSAGVHFLLDQKSDDADGRFAREANDSIRFDSVPIRFDSIRFDSVHPISSHF